MQTVDPNASRYVEVLRGPNATTYGATTLGGAINFVAPTGYTQSGSIGRAEARSITVVSSSTAPAKVRAPWRNIPSLNGGAVGA